MGERLRVDLINHAGDVVYTTQQFTSFNMRAEVGGKGQLTIGFNAADPALSLIDADYIWAVWYQYPERGIGWVNIFNAIHKTLSRTLQQNGRDAWTSYAAGCNEILDKAYILYPSGSSQASKSGPASTVLYEYCKENLGPLATTTNGRDVDHVNPVVFGADFGTGPTWDGARARRNLFQTAQGIRSYSIERGDQIDFRCIYYGHVTGNYEFLIEAGNHFYKDRSTAGLTTQTNGLNGAGNAPVILGPTYGNVERFTRSFSRYSEVNTVIGLGQGQLDNRVTALAQDTVSILRSPIAQRESVVSANQESVAGVQVAAEERLDEQLARPSFSLYPLNTGSQLLFKDYFLGDFVSIQDFDGQLYRRQIVKIGVNASGGEIDKTLEVSDG